MEEFSARIRNVPGPDTEIALEKLKIWMEENVAELEKERMRKIGQRSLKRLFPSFTDDSMTQATLSAGMSGIGFKRARDIAAPAHLGALIAARPHILGVIRDAVRAGLFPEQILETRLSLSEAIETATSTCLSALDNDEQATAKLYVQKAAQAADEAWLQTVQGQQGQGVTTRPSHPSNTQAPPPKRKTVTTWTSQRTGRAHSVCCSSQRSLHDPLIGLVSGA